MKVLGEILDTKVSVLFCWQILSWKCCEHTFSSSRKVCKKSRSVLCVMLVCLQWPSLFSCLQIQFNFSFNLFPKCPFSPFHCLYISYISLCFGELSISGIFSVSFPACHSLFGEERVEEATDNSLKILFWPSCQSEDTAFTSSPIQSKPLLFNYPQNCILLPKQYWPSVHPQPHDSPMLHYP